MAKNFYFLGIKGVGMAALAVYLKQSDFEISGSDNGSNFITDKILKEAGIDYYDGFDAKHITDKIDTMIVSAAYDESNVEIAEAEKKKIKILYYSQMLGEITAEKKLIAVAGVHGKTTTSSLIAFLFEKASLDPSYIIGSGVVANLKGSAHKGEGEYFILESDEYRDRPGSLKPKFLDLTPEVAIISSIELDHPDMYPNIEAIYNAFYSFACRVKRNGTIILCIDYPKAVKLKQTLADRKFITYGFDLAADWQIVDVKEEEETIFSLKKGNQIFGPYKLGIHGKHNVLNACAAIIAGKISGISEDTIKKTLIQFKGAPRRLELVADLGSVKIFDDYAHHPTAIVKTLETLKTRYPKAAIWCIFQPHTYSRTQALLKEFAVSFNLADEVIITDIFSSEREKKGEISGQDLANEIRKHHKNTVYINDWGEITQKVISELSSPAIILTVGAGDIYKLSEQIQDSLRLNRKNF